MPLDLQGSHDVNWFSTLKRDRPLPLFRHHALTLFLIAVITTTSSGARANSNPSVNCSYNGLADSDGDFIPDDIETNADTDGDGIPNHLDTDSDNDGLPDSLELGHSPYAADHDRDGVPLHIDNNDSDPQERCVSGSWGWPLLDMNGNSVADYLEPAPSLYTEDTDPCAAAGGFTDSDRDLIADLIEGDADPDGDGIPNYLDSDSDGDGLSDRTERVYGFSYQWDWDNDGIVEELDVDDDDRSVACLVHMRPPADRNANGVYDFIEPTAYAGDENDPCLIHGGHTDSDGDFIADYLETQSDTDGDGIANYIDDDSDNDGLSDLYEYRSNAQINFGSDNDKDGISSVHDVDDYDHNIACLKPGAAPLDHLADGLADYLDPDSDDDGLIDSEELLYGGRFSVDADKDTLTDVLEIELGLNPGSVDTDDGGANDDWEVFMGTNANDPLDDATLPKDLDVDNDGISDGLENSSRINRDSDGDGRSDSQEAGLPDLNNDGLVDDQTDANLNGQPDIGESLTALPDFDADSVPDMFDVDSDQDGIADKFEFNYFTLPNGYASDPNDVDGDGALNMLDLDSDNDGIFDLTDHTTIIFIEDPTLVKPPVIIRDDNNDGLVDQMRDTDGDNIPDSADHSYLPDEPDTDADQIVDSADIDHAVRYTDYGPDYTVQPRPGRDTDGDGIENDRDPDANNDGGFDLMMDNPQGFQDQDQDGIPALLDTDDTTAFVAGPEVVQQPAAALPETTQMTSGGSGGGSFSGWLLLLMALRRSHRCQLWSALARSLSENSGRSEVVRF